MTKIECPACGSTNINSSTQKTPYAIPYGPPAIICETVHTCEECGTSGSFEKNTEDNALIAIQQAEKESVGLMLQHLTDSGIALAHLERALGLPQRTTARWKAGESSAAVVALLRIVRTYPWILKVSEHRFDPVVADQTLIGESVNIISRWSHHLTGSIHTSNATSLTSIATTGDNFAFLGLFIKAGEDTTYINAKSTNNLEIENEIT